MEPEIELELFAALCAEVEAGRPLEVVLQAEGLHETTWARSRDAWMERMSHEPEAARNALEERYRASFEARKRAIQARRPSNGEDHPTPPRGPLGTVVMMGSIAELRAAVAAMYEAQAQAAKDPPPPSVTPPMGTAAPKAIEFPPPSVTPPMGTAAPKVDVPPARSSVSPEQTPPMWHRSELVSDDLALAASEGDRKTSPPPPVPSRPALPFPSSPTNTAVPHPPPSAPHRQSGMGYPAVAPPPAPMPYPQAASSSSSAYGGYPAMLPLTHQAIAAQAASAPPASGFPAAPKPAGLPLALAGFPATASGPRLSLDVYAAFAAEIAVNPVAVAEIRERYGFSDQAHAAEDDAWQRRFSSDRETYVRYAKLFQHYRDWFSGRTPR